MGAPPGLGAAAVGLALPTDQLSTHVTRAGSCLKVFGKGHDPDHTPRATRNDYFERIKYYILNEFSHASRRLGSVVLLSCVASKHETKNTRTGGFHSRLLLVLSELCTHVSETQK